MTKNEITETLNRYRFVGRYTVSKLAKESGLAPDTIRRAMGGELSQRTQTRLEMLLRDLPPMMVRPPAKRKPGHKKRFLIRYLNLRSWLAILEEHAGKNPKFKLRRRYDLKTTESAGMVCMKLDYMAKWYLLKIFGEELKKKKVFMGDCFSAEKWIDRIEKILPNLKRDLIKKLQHRKGLTQ